MTTLIQHGSRELPTVDVAGVRWPLHKLAAVAAGMLMVVGILAFGGSAVMAAWAAAAVSLAVWWGGFAWCRSQWKHGASEYAVACRSQDR
ncbi:hypothetical protein [Gordonia humi]|uniref:Flp pilus assembly protein TadB n=1 Tax=Gordonia humi TaxID=686429 RepID=A0A840F2K5_9ACTN|nr:hypothetical protein [Gordonia humi]MBB4136864.1 Flp pilus assembly protein TadB [Gordonia humi]